MIIIMIILTILLMVIIIILLIHETHQRSPILSNCQGSPAEVRAKLSTRTQKKVKLPVISLDAETCRFISTFHLKRMGSK